MLAKDGAMLSLCLHLSFSSDCKSLHEFAVILVAVHLSCDGFHDRWGSLIILLRTPIYHVNLL